MRASNLLAAAFLAASLAACHGARADRPIAPVSHVNLTRYMGSWYVIASIPTHFGRDGYNPVETYRLQPDGSICTSFRFREGGFGGPMKKIHSVATVIAGAGDAEWRVHLFWVLREQYIVAWLAPDYSAVIVGRDAHDYMWLMARTPQIPATEYHNLLDRVKAMGYDLSKVRKSPQRWPEAGAAPSFGESCRAPAPLK
jgi:apolipoprotein D and lipocalin family protein